MCVVHSIGLLTGHLQVSILSEIVVIKQLLVQKLTEQQQTLADVTFTIKAKTRNIADILQ